MIEYVDYLTVQDTLEQKGFTLSYVNFDSLTYQKDNTKIIVEIYDGVCQIHKNGNFIVESFKKTIDVLGCDGNI